MLNSGNYIICQQLFLPLVIIVFLCVKGFNGFYPVGTLLRDLNTDRFIVLWDSGDFNKM
jgi:hypothetical protein